MNIELKWRRMAVLVGVVLFGSLLLLILLNSPSTQPVEPDNNSSLPTINDTDGNYTLPEPLPPGVREDLISPDLVVETHTTKLRRTDSFQVGFVREPIGGDRQAMSLRVEHSTYFKQTKVNGELRVESYSDPNGRVSKFHNQNGETSYSVENFSPKFSEHIRRSFVHAVLEGVRFSKPKPAPPIDGKQTLELESRGLVNTTHLKRVTVFREISSINASVRISEDGVVRSIRATIRGSTIAEDQKAIIYRYYISNLSETSVTKPAWVESQRQSTFRTSPRVSSVGNYIMIPHEGGPELGAGTTIEISPNGSPQVHSVTLQDSFEQGDIIYLWFESDLLRKQLNTPPSSASEFPAQEYTIRIVSSSGEQMYETTVRTD